MKYFKFFLTIFAMAIALNASAQSKTTAKAKTTTTTTTSKAKSTTTAPAKKATAAKSTATTTAKTTTTTTATTTATTASKPATTTASKPAATTTTKTASASKPAESKPAKKSTKASFTTKDYDPGYHLMLETKIGGYYGTGGFGENIVLEHEFHKYFAWDIFSIDFSAPFNFNAASIGLKTGIRAFSPYFYDKLNMRAYSSLAAGYDCGLAKGAGGTWVYDPTIDDYVFVPGGNGWSASHGFGLSFGVGIQMIDHLYIGYTLEYSTVWKSTSHFAKITWRF